MGQNRCKSPKIAAKGPFGLLRQFLLLALHCCSSSTAVVTKNAAINTPFSGVFGFLRRAENRRHMLLEFV